MLKFLRTVRRNLLTENKITRYLLYAIGEIVLVVIGILIALSINNWNEARKNSITENEYYCRLLEDFELDRQSVERLKEQCNYRIITGKNLLLDLPNKDRSKAYLINTYIQANRSNAFVPSKAAFLDITSSGNLNIITNHSLKQNLIRYYAELDNLIFQLNFNRNKVLEKPFSYGNENQFGFQFADYAQEALGEEILATLPDSDWQLDPNSSYFMQFQNDLVFFIVMSEREKQHLNNILKEMEPVYNQLKLSCQQGD